MRTLSTLLILSIVLIGCFEAVDTEILIGTRHRA